MVSRSTVFSEINLSSISYSERRLLQDPAGANPAIGEDEQSVVQEAVSHGITLYRAAHEREVITLTHALAELKTVSPLIMSTTDGGVLDRCHDTVESATEAITRSIERKCALLGRSTTDVFSLYDIRQHVHSLARLEGAARTLIPTYREKNIAIIAAKTFSWIGDIPFVRFPNTWRFRNITKNFCNITAAQAHLAWGMKSQQFASVLVSM